MLDTLSLSVTMRLQTCCYSACGLSFAVPKTWDDAKRNDHSSFYCPNGHIQSYAGKSDAERARGEAEAARNALAGERARHDQTRAELATKERERAAQAGAKTRLLNRIKGGVCPNCNRHFDALKRHMDSKHKVKP